jgi:hypothetical protein
MNDASGKRSAARMRTRVPLAGLASLLLLITFVAIAAGGQNSFEGSCAPIQGTTHFDPPITGATALHNFEYKGTARCDLKVNGRQLSEVPVAVDVAGPIEASCASARGTAPAPGSATFTVGSREVVVYFYFLDNTGTLTEFQGRIAGQTSGSGEVHGTFLTTRTPPDTALKCATTGLSDVPTDLSVSTDSPIVSGHQPPGRRHRQARRHRRH